MTKKRAIKDEDLLLFREAVGDVRRLPHDEVFPNIRRPPPIPRQRLQDEKQVLEELLTETVSPAEIETGDELLFRRQGISHGTWRKLRRGHYSVQSEFDLHGMRVREAREALAAFLRMSQERGLRCVRIIHGKGNGSFQKQPVLKTQVNHWLRQWDPVLAFCSARPVDGGAGALYVLLKRPTRESSRGKERKPFNPD